MNHASVPVHRRPRIAIRSRGKDAPCSTVEKRREDPSNLLGRLPFGENGLGCALSKLAMEVDAGEAEVSKRQRGETLERVVRARRPDANVLEQLSQIVAKPCHRTLR